MARSDCRTILTPMWPARNLRLDTSVEPCKPRPCQIWSIQGVLEMASVALLGPKVLFCRCSSGSLKAQMWGLLRDCHLRTHSWGIPVDWACVSVCEPVDMKSGPAQSARYHGKFFFLCMQIWYKSCCDALCYIFGFMAGPTSGAGFHNKAVFMRSSQGHDNGNLWKINKSGTRMHHMLGRYG